MRLEVVKADHPFCLNLLRCDYSTVILQKQSAFDGFKKDYLKFKKSLISENIFCAFLLTRGFVAL